MRQRRTDVYRKLSIHGFDLVKNGHNFFALLEFDITALRAVLRAKRVAGSGGSLFSFMLKAIGACLRDFPEFNSMISLRRTTTFLIRLTSMCRSSLRKAGRKSTAS